MKKNFWAILGATLGVGFFIFCFGAWLFRYSAPQSNADRVNVVVAVVGAASTLFAALSAFIAYSTVKEMQREHKEENLPFVFVDCPFERDLMVFLHIQNLGKSIARNVRFEFSPSPVSFENIPLADNPVFQHPIPMLAPNREWRIYIDHFNSIIGPIAQNTTSAVFTVTAFYEDEYGIEHTNQYPIDLRNWEHRAFSVSTPEESLAKIARVLEQQQRHDSTLQMFGGTIRR